MLANKKIVYSSLLFFLIILIGGLSYIFYFQRSGPRLSLVQESSDYEVSLPQANPQTLLTFAPPVRYQTVESAKLEQLSLGFDDLAFKLQENSFIYAGFSGYVNVIGSNDSDQKIILLNSNDNQGLYWRYIFSGEFLVSEEEFVEEGSVIAKVSSTLPTRDSNLIIQAQLDDEQYSFSPADLKTIVPQYEP